MSTFSTFGGSSRKPRQVNLSGRKANPFATIGSGFGSQEVVAKAQQEREKRHREGERLKAARTIQRSWRRHSNQKATNVQLRREFDDTEGETGYSKTDIQDVQAYASAFQAYRQLLLLHRFFDSRNIEDLSRLQRCMSRRYQTRKRYIEGSLSIREERSSAIESNKPEKHVTISPTLSVNALYADLQKRLILMLDRATSTKNKDSSAWFDHIKYIIDSFALVSARIPKETALNADQIYSALAKLVSLMPGSIFCCKDSFLVIRKMWSCPIANTTYKTHENTGGDNLLGLGVEEDAFNTDRAPSESLDGDVVMAEDHVEQFHGNTSTLTIPSELLQAYLYNTRPLLRLLEHLSGNSNSSAGLDLEWSLQQLASTIDFSTFIAALDKSANSHFQDLSDVLFPGGRVRLAATLVYFQQKYYKRITVDAADLPYQQYLRVVSKLLSSLSPRVNMDSVDDEVPLEPFLRKQLWLLRRDDHLKSLLSRMSSLHANAAEVASLHVLALLKFFPQQADEIRMKLCLQAARGKTKDGQIYSIPALAWFWQASLSAGSDDRIVSQIQSHPHAAVRLLNDSSGRSQDGWRIILCFLELYTFITKVTDDDEFLAGNNNMSYKTLPLQDIRQLSKFLMNLGFAMSFYASEILGGGTRPDVEGLRARFSSIRAGQSSTDDQLVSTQMIAVGGVEIEYFKNVVTGLLSMLYQRDSRRKFLEDGFWLMTSHLDMGGFTDAVVAEEERRREAELHESDSEDEEDEAESFHWTSNSRQSTRRQAKSRNRALVHTYMANVAPRLEILRHMPFMIMFPVRLQIFRQFVHGDKYKRRGGTVEPDIWRMRVMSIAGEEGVKRHSATVQRGREVQDSLEAFWDLGEGLKEPIQITFLDQYGNPEMGIDGGGITKEFLMSVTKQALTGLIDVGGVVTQLFVENEQRFLYPNPTAVEEVQLGYNVAEDKARVALLLRYFEFLGRIIGKCLYEGILIDALFAGFFVLKWGGDFRADLNSLRDLDEELYRNMLQLKNYDGDVEDLGLTFSIADRIPDRAAGSDTDRRTAVRELAPNGANMAVDKGNRLVYIGRVARYRLVMQCKSQTDSFIRGLTAMIQPSWLSMFNQSELQALIGGDAVPIDLADLRQNTQYGGIYQIGTDGLEHPTIRLFWDVVAALDEEDKRAILKFVTSTPRAPLLGFKSLNPKFSIRDSGSDENRLPSAATCVNLLKLPAYKNPKKMREKLLTAITSGAGFDLS